MQKATKKEEYMAVELSKEFLLSVMKPARYIGEELGSVKKDLSSVDVSVCLCFPDTYEIGMSHLGLRILYDLINKRSEYAAERVFSPWIDMEEKMRAADMPLFSLESKIPVKEFDILGFSIQYELSYTNVLNILSLSGMPLKSIERDRSFPLVIAGGACSLNPEPLADFIDLFVVGEAEEVIFEILAKYKVFKDDPNMDKTDLLKDMSNVDGVYVPLVARGDKKVVKRFMRDLSGAMDLEHWVVPYIEIVHDRLSIEIMRGCPNICNFCQARSAFYPTRILKADKVVEIAKRLYQKTGYDEISLLSLSSSDHPELEEIVKRLDKEFRDKGVSIALPSLRAKTYVGELSRVLASMRKTSLTFAPEAGTQRLRDVIRKNIDIDELFAVVRQAYKSGYRLLKLYFMIGLPTETKADLDGIIDLTLQLSRLKKEVDGHPAQLNVSISNFIPKPHTLFQRHGMDSLESLLEKQEYLRNSFKKFKGTIHPSFHDCRTSIIEGIFACGDRRLGQVILDAFKSGAKFDAWSNFFNYSLWQEAFKKSGIEPLGYLGAKPDNETLAWDYIKTGI